MWVQELVRDEAVALYKVKGELNPADLLAKPLGRAALDARLHHLRARREAGRAASAPAASAEVDTSLAAAAPRVLKDTHEGARPRWADLAEEEE